jgi:hypothetical protein
VAAASAPTKPVIGPDDENEKEWEVAGSAAPRARPTKPVEEDELKLCWSKTNSTDYSSPPESSTDENEKGFNRELERNPAFACCYCG